MAKNDVPDLEQLEHLLRVLRKHGVTHYRTSDVELRLGKQGIAPPKDNTEPTRNANEKDAPPAPQALKSLYEHHSLWPDGKRPSFDEV